MKKLPKVKKGAWFVKLRGSYLPMTWQGRLTYIPYLGYLMAVLVFAAQTSENAMQFVMIIVPQWVAAVAIMTWIAARKS